jgi:hypothetical protein
MDLEHVEEARTSAQEHETARHEVTVRQASILFAEFGVPRSPRSVQGFCKDGHLDCVAVKGPNGDRYLINRESIERYATELKQIDEVAKIGVQIDSAPLREAARESAQERAQPETPDDIPVAATEAPVNGQEEAFQRLREENLNLRVDNIGKEKFIAYLAGENRRLADVVQDVSYRLGAAETLVHQLEAPKEPVHSSAQEREPDRNDDTRVEVIVAPPVSTTPENAPPSFFRRIFG